MRRPLAEFLGTFILVFAGTGAIVIDHLTGGVIGHAGIALTFGLVVLAMIYTFGDISGAHLNPAVSIAFAAAGRFPWREVPLYLGSQLAGAFAASGLLKFLFPGPGTLGTTLPAGDLLDVQSAGSKPAGYVHPLAIKALAEIGIDISAHHSKHMDEFLSQDVETVITVCGNADQACPMFPGQLNRHHWGFDDPAHATGTEDEQMAVFRRVRDEIRKVFEAYAAGRRDAK